MNFLTVLTIKFFFLLLLLLISYTIHKRRMQSSSAPFLLFYSFLFRFLFRNPQERRRFNQSFYHDSCYFRVVSLVEEVIALPPCMYPCTRHMCLAVLNGRNRKNDRGIFLLLLRITSLTLFSLCVLT